MVPVPPVLPVPLVPLVGPEDLPLEAVLLLLYELPLELEEMGVSGGRSKSLAVLSMDPSDGPDLDLIRWMTVTDAPKGPRRNGMDIFLKRRRGSGALSPSMGDGAGQVAGSLTELLEAILVLETSRVFFVPIF